jgi:coenzyme F420-reducing hydrogenase alpha subunit
MEGKETGLNERELEEILEMARDAAEKARSMCEVITENSKKWRERAEKSIERDRDSDRVFLRL